MKTTFVQVIRKSFLTVITLFVIAKLLAVNTASAQSEAMNFSRATAGSVSPFNRATSQRAPGRWPFEVYRKLWEPSGRFGTNPYSEWEGRNPVQRNVLKYFQKSHCIWSFFPWRWNIHLWDQYHWAEIREGFPDSDNNRPHRNSAGKSAVNDRFK